MSSVTEGSRVPAWKKLGLKLKQPTGPDGSAPSAARADGPVGQQHQRQQNGGGQTPKRKFDAPLPAAAADDSPVGHGSAIKRPRREDDSNKRHINKSVSFGDTPTKADLVKSSSTSLPTKSPISNKKPSTTTTTKTAKGPAKKQKPQPVTDLKPALEYLREWKTSNATWKFNKNHQSTLIKHVFDDNGIPSKDINTFYEYIRDLKGYVRIRLREQAMEVKTHDQTIGAQGFPEKTKDVAGKQSTYESMLVDFFGPSPSPVGQKRKNFDEAEFVTSSDATDVLIKRVIKRMRAELILDDLSDSGETDMSTTSSRSAASSETLQASDNNANAAAAAPAAENGKKATGSAAAGKRRRKLRTAVDDDSSSSSDSDSSDEDSDNDDDDDSDSSSEGSSSDDDSEDEARPKRTGTGYTDSDSSSSSSSSEDEDSDDESD